MKDGHEVWTVIVSRSTCTRNQSPVEKCTSTARVVDLAEEVLLGGTRKVSCSWMTRRTTGGRSGIISFLHGYWEVQHADLSMTKPNQAHTNTHSRPCTKMAGLRAVEPPERLRVRGLGPTVTLTMGGPFTADAPAPLVKLDLRCRECDRRLDDPLGPAACEPDATAPRAAATVSFEARLARLVREQDQERTFNHFGIRLPMEALHESGIPLHLPRQLARASRIPLAQRPLALLLEPAPLRVRKARAGAKHRDFSLFGGELAIGVDRRRDRVERYGRRGAAVGQRGRDGAHLARAAVTVVLDPLPEVVVFPLTLALPFPFAMSMRARTVTSERDKADTLGWVGWRRVRDDCRGNSNDGLDSNADSRCAVNKLREEVGEEDTEGDAQDSARCLNYVCDADEVDDELRGDADDNNDDCLGELSKGVVDENTLEEAVKEEVWGRGDVCRVGDDSVDEDTRAEGEEKRETSRELHTESGRVIQTWKGIRCRRRPREIKHEGGHDEEHDEEDVKPSGAQVQLTIRAVRT